MGSRVGVDVGGTFIDVIAYDEATGEVVVEKQPATPDRLADELIAALERLPGDLASITELLHGSTVAINTLLQRRGATVGLITTTGFRDVLELGRGNRPHIYDWVWNPPVPLVPRARRREVTERMGPGGEVISPLDTEGLDRETDALVADGVEAIAICFLHAYANPAHEAQAAARIAARHPGMPLTMSASVAAEWHEFERTSTAVVNAYLQPVFGTYLADVEQRVRRAATPVIAVMQSNGGLMPVARAAELPVRTLASGPAGGVIGAASMARRLGHPDVICADVGGTSFDVAIFEDGHVQERTESSVVGLPVLAPSVDVVSVGAGGGSIAWRDQTGGLRVGPASAGAVPGPACFGLGGEEATVTDCQLLLGMLDPDRFLGSRMRLFPDAAERAVRRHVADPLGLPLDAAAAGVLTIAQDTMASAIHVMTVERGSDPRRFALCAYGGGGGLFAAAIADELSVSTVVIPRGAASFSAWGLLTAEHREDASITRVRPLNDDEMPHLLAQADDLVDQVVARLVGLGFPPDPVDVQRLAELRFVGQEHTIAVPIDPERGTQSAASLGARFVERHRQLYGHGALAASKEVVTLRCRATVRTEEPRWPAWPAQEPGSARTERPVYFGDAGGWIATSVFDRDGLAVDQRIDGPAVIEEWSSTTIVPPTWSASTDVEGNLILTREVIG